MKENIHWAIMTVKVDWLLNKYILNGCFYLEINFVCKRIFAVDLPEDCLSNMKLKVVNYWNSYIYIYIYIYILNLIYMYIHICIFTYTNISVFLSLSEAWSHIDRASEKKRIFVIFD